MELKCDQFFKLKEITSKNKAQLLRAITAGDKLIEIDDLLYAYLQRTLRPLILAELADRFLIELSRNEKQGLHLVEFFCDGNRYFIKPAACKLEDDGVDRLLKFSSGKMPISQSVKNRLNSELKLKLD